MSLHPIFDMTRLYFLKIINSLSAHSINIFIAILIINSMLAHFINVLIAILIINSKSAHSIKILTPLY